MKVKHFFGHVRVTAAKESRRLLTLASVTTGAAGTVSAGPAINYNAFFAQGYRWVTVDGPYGCPPKADLRQITRHGTEDANLAMVEQRRAYYLIPGTMVQVVQEDRASATSKVRVAGIVRELWTVTKCLTHRPMRDPYGVIETPETARFDAATWQTAS